MRRLSQGEADTRSQKPVHAGAKNLLPRPPQECQSSPTRFETETRLNVSVGGTSRSLSLSRGSLAGDGWATNPSGCRSNLVCGAVALHGAFTFHAQVHPLDKFDPPGHRYAAVDRQQPRALVRHRPVADVGLYLFQDMPSVPSVSLLVRSTSALSHIRSTWVASAPHSSNADFWPASKYRTRPSKPNPPASCTDNPACRRVLRRHRSLPCCRPTDPRSRSSASGRTLPRAPTPSGPPTSAASVARCLPSSVSWVWSLDTTRSGTLRISVRGRSGATSSTPAERQPRPSESPDRSSLGPLRP